MIEGFVTLLLCQLAGELAVRTLHLALPGPVLGMLVLLGVLVVRNPRPESSVLQAGDRMLGILPLLFVPAGVGVMTQVTLLRTQWLPIGVGLVVSWAVALVATAGAALLVHARGSDPTDAEADALVVESDRMEGLEHESRRSQAGGSGAPQGTAR